MDRTELAGSVRSGLSTSHSRSGQTALRAGRYAQKRQRYKGIDLGLKEMANQSLAFAASLEQTTYQMIASSEKEYATLLMQNPQTLQWHLTSRGYPASSDPEINKRMAHALLRLTQHESIFLSHQSGLITDNLWLPWNRVLESDLEIPEFANVWPRARLFYAVTFAAHVDQIVAKA